MTKLSIVAVIALLYVPNLDAFASTPDLMFPKATFYASHNSYSGNLDGLNRGGIIEQLDAEVRFIEYDIFTLSPNDTCPFGIGHDAPGDELDLDHGNPQTYCLENWLQIIAEWSKTHEHNPLTVMVDLKDDLSDGIGFGMDVLDSMVENIFDKLLWTPKDLQEFRDTHSAPWPTVSQMRNKVLVLMSGNAESRLAYWQLVLCVPHQTYGNDGVIFTEYQVGNSAEYLEPNSYYGGAVERELSEFTPCMRDLTCPTRIWRHNSPREDGYLGTFAASDFVYTQEYRGMVDGSGRRPAEP
eukprot:2704103-Pleurochrysis_carterae.AAC.1